MQDIVVGVLAVAIGALFCFRGYIAMRVVIPIWGAFAGFVLGAGIVDAASDDGFLRSVLAWIAAIVLAFLFAAFAYLYYEVSVVLGMGAIGFALGASLMVALGISWSWLIVLVGVVVAVALGLIAIVADLPALLLFVLSALGGASTIVAGLMLLFGAVDTAEFASSAVTEQLDDDWWWYALYVVLAIAGMVSQLRSAERLDASLRDTWSARGGRQFRLT